MVSRCLIIPWSPPPNTWKNTLELPISHYPWKNFKWMKHFTIWGENLCSDNVSSILELVHNYDTICGDNLQWHKTCISQTVFTSCCRQLHNTTNNYRHTYTHFTSRSLQSERLPGNMNITVRNNIVNIYQTLKKFKYISPRWSLTPCICHTPEKHSHYYIIIK